MDMQQKKKFSTFKYLNRKKINLIKTTENNDNYSPHFNGISLSFVSVFMYLYVCSGACVLLTHECADACAHSHKWRPEINFINFTLNFLTIDVKVPMVDMTLPPLFNPIEIYPKMFWKLCVRRVFIRKDLLTMLFYSVDVGQYNTVVIFATSEDRIF